MSFQQRLFLAFALCAAIWLVFDVAVPKPEVSADESVTESGAGDERGPDVVPSEQGQPPAVLANESSGEGTDSGLGEFTQVAATQHTLDNGTIALQVSNDSPATGLIGGLTLHASQFSGQSTATDAMHLGGSPTLGVSFADEASDVRVPKEIRYQIRDADARHVALALDGGGDEIREQLELLDGYEAKLVVAITNRSARARDHRIHVSVRVGKSDSRYDISRGLCRTAEDLEEEDASDVEDGPIPYGPGIRWGGVDNKYFGQFVVPGDRHVVCEIREVDHGAYVETRLSGAVVTLQPGEEKQYTFALFLGPKELEQLQDFSARVGTEDDKLDVQAAISWGFFGRVSEGLGRMLLAMLRWFYGLTASWGVAIILLTVLVKGVTLPLTLKQMSSMKHMRAIGPEIAKIKQKYSDDRVKQGQEMQALYARSGVNPLAGCLPTLVQLPVWFALYSMLSAAVELVHQKFLWLPDLTKQDPYFVLPLAFGAMSIVQSRMTPMAGQDEAQARMMRWMMPVMFTAFMLFIPSGLGIYMFANTLLSVVQTAVSLGIGKNAGTAKT